MERRKSEETEKEPQAPVQGASGAGGSEGREDTGGVVVAVRRAPEPDHAMEESAPGASGVGIQRREISDRGAGGSEGFAREDRGVDAGERFFRKRAHQGGHAERKAMIDPGPKLSISRQAKILEISRSSVYYTPRPVSPADLELMKAIDRLHLEAPYAGSRDEEETPSR